MSSVRSTVWRALPRRGGAALRPVAVVAAVGCCAVTLSACRTIDGTESGSKKADHAQHAAVVPTPPVAVPSSPTVAATSVAPAAAASTPTSPAGSSPGGEAATTPHAPATTPTDAAATSPGGAVAAVSTTPQPRKLVVKNPWLVVGRPYVVDTMAPRSTTSGLTGYELVFRTRGDFRGVRAGTAITDDRHYKVGKIELPRITGYVPSGQVNLQLGDRNKSNGRYCWLATIAKTGTGNPLSFTPQAAGTALAITFDLYRSTAVQNRTAPVFVRTHSGEQPSALQNKLGCHLNYF